MPAQELGNELQTITETLRNKGIDPEKAAESLSQFLEAQKQFGEAIKRYNEAANTLATSMGIEIEEGQKAKFPENMRIPDQDIRKYLRLSRETDKIAASLDSAGL